MPRGSEKFFYRACCDDEAATFVLAVTHPPTRTNRSTLNLGCSMLFATTQI